MCCKDSKVVKIKYDGTLEPPKIQTEGAAGIDLFNNEENVKINSYESGIISTGVKAEIPEGYVGLLFPRSSLGFKYDCTLSNSVGVIDSDFRGEIKAKIHNHSQNGKVIERGERIAQMVVVPCLTNFIFTDELSTTERGENGFGSTGENKNEKHP